MYVAIETFIIDKPVIEWSYLPQGREGMVIYFFALT